MATKAKIKARKIKINYAPHKGFKTLHQIIDKNRVVLAKSGIGAGKTVFGANEVIRQMIKRPGIHVLCLGPTFPILQVAIRTFLQYCPQQIIREFKKTPYPHGQLLNGSWVEFRSCTDPDSLRGTGPDLIWIDEAAYITDYAWDVVYLSLIHI